MRTVCLRTGDSSKCFQLSPNDTLPVHSESTAAGLLPANTSCSPCSVWFLKDRSPLGQWGRILSSRKVWFPIFKSNLGSQLGSLLFPASAAPMPSPLKLMTDRAFDAFTPKGVVISKREKPGQVYQKEDDLPKGLPKEATVLGVSTSPYRGNPGKNIMNVSRPQSTMDLGDSFFLPP